MLNGLFYFVFFICFPVVPSRFLVFSLFRFSFRHVGSLHLYFHSAIDTRHSQNSATCVRVSLPSSVFRLLGTQTQTQTQSLSRSKCKKRVSPLLFAFLSSCSSRSFVLSFGLFPVIHSVFLSLGNSFPRRLLLLLLLPIFSFSKSHRSPVTLPSLTKLVIRNYAVSESLLFCPSFMRACCGYRFSKAPQ